MSKAMPLPPALDLPSLSIHDLWCLSDLFEQLSHEAMSFLNEPRVSGSAEAFAYALWDHYCNGTRTRIIEEMMTREPADRTEAGWKAEAIIRHLSHGDSFHELLEAASEAIQSRKHLAA